MPTQSAKMALDGHLEMAETLRKKQYLINKEIRKLSEKKIYKENYTLLLSVPGVGCLTAMIILTEIGDIKRFQIDQQRSIAPDAEKRRVPPHQ